MIQLKLQHLVTHPHVGLTPSVKKEMELVLAHVFLNTLAIPTLVVNLSASKTQIAIDQKLVTIKSVEIHVRESVDQMLNVTLLIIPQAVFVSLDIQEIHLVVVVNLQEVNLLKTFSTYTSLNFDNFS